MVFGKGTKPLFTTHINGIPIPWVDQWPYLGVILTRPDTRPSVACGWAGAVMLKNRRKSNFYQIGTDQWTNEPIDQRTDGPTDGHTLL